jgi:hypothetical protein
MACLFSMITWGCVRLCALKLLACCARSHLTRAALLTVMRSRPLCTIRCLSFNFWLSVLYMRSGAWLHACISLWSNRLPRTASCAERPPHLFSTRASAARLRPLRQFSSRTLRSQKHIFHESFKNRWNPCVPCVPKGKYVISYTSTRSYIKHPQ